MAKKSYYGTKRIYPVCKHCGRKNTCYEVDKHYPDGEKVANIIRCVKLEKVSREMEKRMNKAFSVFNQIYDEEVGK